MPLNQLGFVNHGSSVDEKTELQIREVFSMLDKEIREQSRSKGLSPAQVKLLQPLHQCSFVGDKDIYVVCWR